MAAWYNSGDWTSLKRQEWINPLCQLMYTLNQWEKILLLGAHDDPWAACSTLASWAATHGVTVECPMTKWTDKNGASIVDPVPSDFDGMTINGTGFVGNIESLLDMIQYLWLGTASYIIDRNRAIPSGYFPPRRYPWPAIIPVDGTDTWWPDKATFIESGGYGSSLISLSTMEDVRPFIQAKNMLDALEALGHLLWYPNMSAYFSLDGRATSHKRRSNVSFTSPYDDHDYRWAYCYALPDVNWLGNYGYVGPLWSDYVGVLGRATTTIYNDYEYKFLGSLMQGTLESSNFYVRTYATNTDTALTITLPDSTTVTAPATAAGSTHEVYTDHDTGTAWLTIGTDYDWDSNDNTSPTTHPINGDTTPTFSIMADIRVYFLGSFGTYLLSTFGSSYEKYVRMKLNIENVITHEAP